MTDKKEIIYMTAEEGAAQAKKGYKFEEEIANILDNVDNFKIIKNKKSSKVGYRFDIYKRLINVLNIDVKNVVNISATSDKKKIGCLPSGGAPKTDVLVTILKTNGKIEYRTITCKKTRRSRVAVHEYSIDKFVEVLKLKDKKLIAGLYDFQRAGNQRDMNADLKAYLKEHLKDYFDELAFWVIGGINGPGNKDVHWANYIVTYNEKNNNISIHTVNEYIEKLKNEKGFCGSFKSGFGWTYSSKQRGKSVQLKMCIL